MQKKKRSLGWQFNMKDKKLSKLGFKGKLIKHFYKKKSNKYGAYLDVFLLLSGSTQGCPLSLLLNSFLGILGSIMEQKKKN